MTALASAADFSAYLGDDVSESPRAAALLDIASDLVRAYTRQTISAVVGDVALLRADGSVWLHLPERPVTHITELSVGGVTAPPAEYAWTADGTVVWRAWAVGTVVRVTYDHGYVTIPGDIRSAVLALASRLWQNPHGIRSESEGNYSVSYGGDFSALSAMERQILNRYRLSATTMSVAL